VPAPPARVTKGGSDVSVDTEVLRLREEGRSYAAVARLVHLERAHEAHAAFVRALRRRPHDEQAGLIDRERSRLDQLEVKIRDRDRDDPTRLARRLAAVERLRSAVS